MAVPTLTANSPQQGAISWAGFSIAYNGQQYAIAAGWTDAKFVWWAYNGGAGGPLQAGNSLPTLTADDLLLFLNKDGTPVNAQMATIVDGSIIASESILGDAIAANTITGAKLIAGAISAREIEADAVTAEAIAANGVLAYHILAGQITAEKLESMLVLSSEVYAGDPAGNHARMTATGFYAGAVDGQGVVRDSVRIGTATGDRLAIPDPSDPTGERTLANLDEQGDLSVQNHSVAGDLTVQGNSLLELIAAHPRGIIASGFLGSGAQWGPTSGRLGIGEISFINDPARQYEVTLQGLHVFNSASNTRVLVSMRYTADGSTPTISNGTVFASAFVDTRNANAAYTAPSLITSGTFSAVDGALIRILITIEPFGGGSATALAYNAGDAYHNPFRVFVKDVGADVPDTYVANTGGGSTVQPKTNYVGVWASTSNEAYDGSNNPRTDTDDLIQGYDAYNGNGHSMIRFPSNAIVGETGKTITQALAGAQIKRVLFYAYAQHWWYASGGTAILRGVNSSVLNGTVPSGAYVASAGWPRNAGRWVDITSIWQASFNTVWLGKGLGVQDRTYYGRFTGGADPRIQVEYTR